METQTLPPTKSDPISLRLTTFEEKMLADLRTYFCENRQAIFSRALFFLWQNRERLSNPETLTGWQPLETAPRDGTRILAITNYGKPCVMHFDDQNSDFVRNTTCRRCDGYGLSGLVAWHPLPDTPGWIIDKKEATP